LGCEANKPNNLNEVVAAFARTVRNGLAATALRLRMFGDGDPG
jgi:hypothetical protein